MSSLEDTIAQQYVDAYKARNDTTVSVLRMLKSALSNARIAQENELSDDDVIGVIRKEAKKRQEAIDLYTHAGNREKVQNEQAELALLNTYLPSQMSEDAIVEVVKNAITRTGASSASDFGKVMGECMSTLKGKADAGLVSACVKKQLES